MKRLFIMLICLSLLLAGCTGNKDDTPAESDSESQSQTDGGADDGRIYAVKDGAPLFTIVYGSNANATHAEYLASSLKSKTGVTFRIVTSPQRIESGNAIYVGLHDGVEGLYELYGDSISYNGYGAVYKDGDIYLCGYNETTVGRSVNKFSSGLIADYVTKDENGKTEAYFVDGMLFLSNPAYEEKAPELLGAPLSHYTVTTGIFPELAVKRLAEEICYEIGVRTGAYLRVKEESDSERRITLTPDDTLDLFDYTAVSDGTSINVRFGGVCALYAAFEELTALDSPSEISISNNAKSTFLSHLPLSTEAGAAVRVTSANLMGAGLEESYQCPVELRSALMAEYVMALSPDSVGLQEYNGGNRADFLSVVSDKYAVVSFEGYGVPTASTIYLKDKYTVAASKAINIRVEESAGDPKAQNYYFTWVVLQNKATGEQYVHANLHLEYRTDALRLAQCEMIKAELDAVMAEYSDAILVISGDYNSKISDDSPIFDAIAGEAPLECAELAAPEGKADDEMKSFHTLCAYESMKTGSPSALDHVMVNTETTSVLLHRIINDRLICHASDHCPVLVDVARK